MVKSGDKLSMIVDGQLVGSIEEPFVAEQVVWGYLKKDGANVKDAREKMDEVVGWLASR